MLLACLLPGLLHPCTRLLSAHPQPPQPALPDPRPCRAAASCRSVAIGPSCLVSLSVAVANNLLYAQQDSI